MLVAAHSIEREGQKLDAEQNKWHQATFWNGCPNVNVSPIRGVITRAPLLLAAARLRTTGSSQA